MFQSVDRNWPNGIWPIGVDSLAKFSVVVVVVIVFVVACSWLLLVVGKVWNGFLLGKASEKVVHFRFCGKKK